MAAAMPTNAARSRNVAIGAAGLCAVGVLVALFWSQPWREPHAGPAERAGPAHEDAAIARGETDPASAARTPVEEGRAATAAAARHAQDRMATSAGGPAPFGIDGVVVDAAGRAIPDAHVFVSGHGHMPSYHATSDATGRFSLDGLTGEPEVSAHLDGRAPSQVYGVRGVPGSRVALTIVAGGIGATIRGRVLDADGRPCRTCALARITTAAPFEQPSAYVIAFGPPEVRAEIDADGTFTARHLTPGPTTILIVPDGEADDHTVWQRDVRLVEGDDVVVDVALARGFTITGTVRDANGAPVEGATVFADHRDAISDDTGVYELRGLGPGEVVVAASAGVRGKTSVTLRGDAGAIVHADLVLPATGAIRGRVFDAGGEPLAGWIVSARVDRNRRGAVAESSPDGSFELLGLPDEPHLVRVATAHDSPPVLVVESVAPGGDELTLRVPRGVTNSAAIAGIAMFPGGATPASANAAVFFPDLAWSHDTAIDATTGSFRLDGLPAGTCELRITSLGFPVRSLCELVLHDGQRLDVGELSIVRGSRVVVELDGPARGASCLLGAIDAAGTGGTAILVRDGRGESVFPLELGDYVLRPQDAGVAVFELPFEVRDAADTRLRVAVERGTRCELRVEGADRGTVDLELRDDLDRRAWTWRLRGRPYTVERALRPGAWVAIATTGDGRRGERRFEVGETSATVTIRIR